MEIVEDLDEKVTTTTVNPGNRGGFCVWKPNFFILSLFIIFVIFSFFHFFSFSFSFIFLSFSFIFFHFLSFHFLSFSFIFCHVLSFFFFFFCSFSFCRGLKIFFFRPQFRYDFSSHFLQKNQFFGQSRGERRGREGVVNPFFPFFNSFSFFYFSFSFTFSFSWILFFFSFFFSLFVFYSICIRVYQNMFPPLVGAPRRCGVLTTLSGIGLGRLLGQSMLQLPIVGVEAPSC